MNHIHCIVWSICRAAWIVAPEGTRTQGRGSRSERSANPNRSRTSLSRSRGLLLGLAAYSLSPLPVWAQSLPTNTLPTSGQVTAGSASLQQNGNVLQIDQSSQRAAIQWGTFNVGSGAQVNFNQPNAQAITLNRVLDGNASQIHGRINANGQVWLINPNGILFGKTANVDVGGLMAGTHRISDANFMAGGNTLSEPSSRASVVNQGQLQAKLGGYIALLAPEVRNEGVIVVPLGTAVLASGADITMNLNGSSLTGVTVTPSQLNALVENKGAVIADEGMVILSARAVDSLLTGVINNSGSISAKGLTHKGGRILLEASSQTMLTGNSQIDASSANGAGGEVTVTAQEIGVVEQSRIDASGATGGGQIHIGGEWQGGGITPQARAVYVGANTTLDASAKTVGNGGEIVVWSDVNNNASATRVYGRLNANAGAYGGNGGRIETSGHYVDVYGIKATAAAPYGVGGVWLLDPYDLTISGSATDTSTSSGPPYLFSSGAGGTNVLNTDIEAQLNAGTSVTLRTSGSNGDGLGNGDITFLNGVDITKTAGGDATLRLEAHRNIALGDTTISSNNNKLNVVFTADVDGVDGGAISIINGTIFANGGDISLTGVGLSSPTGNTGILLQGASLITSGDGNITASGTGGYIVKNEPDTASHSNGMSLIGAAITVENGAMTLTGIGAGDDDIGLGMDIWGGTKLTSTGVGGINLVGRGAPNGTTESIGINIYGSTISTKDGNVYLDGVGGGAVDPAAVSGVGRQNYGVVLADNSKISVSGTGGITVQGRGGADGTYAGNTEVSSSHAIWMKTGAKIESANAGLIDIIADSFNSDGSTSVSTGGTVRFRNYSAGTTINLGAADLLTYSGRGLGLSAAEINDITAETLMLGRNDATGTWNVVVSGAVNLASIPNLTLISTGGIAINAPLTVANHLTMISGISSTVTQTVDGAIKAGGLALGGGYANYVLDTAAGNQVSVLSANAIGVLRYKNSGALEVGSAGTFSGVGFNGVNANGPVAISTNAGNLTISQNISTTDTSAAAIVLNAGVAAAAGNSSGGNIVVTNGRTITTGSGGRATLMTGSITGSTGAAALAGVGSGRLRYNSDEVNTNYTAPLSSGLYVVYRELAAVEGPGVTPPPPLPPVVISPPSVAPPGITLPPDDEVPVAPAPPVVVIPAPIVREPSGSAGTAAPAASSDALDAQRLEVSVRVVADERSRLVLMVTLPADAAGASRTKWLPLPAADIGCGRADASTPIEWQIVGKNQPLPSWISFDATSCAFVIRDAPRGRYRCNCRPRPKAEL